MQNSARHAFKTERQMRETVKNDVFYPFFEASKTINHRFSLYNVFTNLLTTPYKRIEPLLIHLTIIFSCKST